MPTTRESPVATTVGDQMLFRLREWDVEHLFGYPGDGINSPGRM